MDVPGKASIRLETAPPEESRNHRIAECQKKAASIIRKSRVGIATGEKKYE
jgi:hypothetical protein